MTKLFQTLLGKTPQPTAEEFEALTRATATLQWRVEQMAKQADFRALHKVAA